jgi:hypothetical protein
VYFWADHPTGANEGVAPPAEWKLEYWDGRKWLAVPHASVYGTELERFNQVRFDPITTRKLRATFMAPGGAGHFAAVAAEEWEALVPEAHTAQPQ